MLTGERRPTSSDSRMESYDHAKDTDQSDTVTDTASVQSALLFYEA